MEIAEKRVISIDELLSNINNRKELNRKEAKISSLNDRTKTTNNETVKKPKHLSNNLHFGTMVLVLLVAALGSMVVILKNDVTVLKEEVLNLRNLKEQVSAIDPKLKIAVIENKLEDAWKENKTIKDEMTQMKNTLDELKNTKVERKKYVQR